MAQERDTSMNPTGLLYTNKKIKLTVGVDSLERLIQLSHFVKGKVLLDFKAKYGNILDLLQVPVQTEALTTLGQFWDATLRCFTFHGFQLAPTIEEYGEILRMPVEKNSTIYMYPGHLPSKNAVAKVLGIQAEDVRMVSPGQTEGISRQDLEKLLHELAKKEDWAQFNRVLALAIYGIILFPSMAGVIDLRAISVFLMIEHYQINPVPAILAETYMALTRCHTKKGGGLKCCLPLLNIWIMSHICGKENPFRQRHDIYSNPLTTFRLPRKYTELDRNGWMTVFEQLKEESLLWKIEWWMGDEILYSCGTFQNVPLVGPRGCINYNPSLALRQLAFTQKVPSEEEVQAIYFLHEQVEMEPFFRTIKEAWQEPKYNGRAELGIRTINATPEYTAWITNRLRGAGPAFVAQSLFQNKEPQEVNQHLLRRLEAKEIELEGYMKSKNESKEKLQMLHNECTILRRKVEEVQRKRGREERSEINQLKKENRKLKGAIEEAQKQAEEQKERIRRNEVRLMKVVKEKDALKQGMQNFRPLEELQYEINGLTQQLEAKVNELAATRGDAAQRAQELSRKLANKNGAMQRWRTLYYERNDETKEWKDRFRRMVTLANTALPDFVWALPRAKNMIPPSHAPAEVEHFFEICTEIVEELGMIARF